MEDEDGIDDIEEGLTAPTRSSTGISSISDFSVFSMPSPEKEKAPTEEQVAGTPKVAKKVPKVTKHAIKKAKAAGNHKHSPKQIGDVT